MPEGAIAVGERRERIVEILRCPVCADFGVITSGHVYDTVVRQTPGTIDPEQIKMLKKLLDGQGDLQKMIEDLQKQLPGMPDFMRREDAVVMSLRLNESGSAWGALR